MIVPKIAATVCVLSLAILAYEASDAECGQPLWHLAFLSFIAAVASLLLWVVWAVL